MSPPAPDPGLALIDALSEEAMQLLLRRLEAIAGGAKVAERSRTAYTVKSLAAELGLSPRAVRGAIARGELRAVRAGRSFIIGIAAVEAWTKPPPRNKAVDGRPAHGQPASGGVMTTALAELDSEGYSDRKRKRPGGARTPRGRQQEASPDAALR
jgi:excisionase family DNA binding protein